MDECFDSLVFAIVEQAIRDYMCPNPVNGKNKDPRYGERAKARIKENAEAFLLSDYCLFMCDVVGIDRNVISKSLGIKKALNPGHHV